MKYPALLGIVALLMSIWSCEPDEVTAPEEMGASENFSLTLAPYYDGNPALTLTNYEDHEGRLVNFEQLRMYIAEIILLKSNGDSICISPIEFYEISNGPATRDFEVPEGNYDGLIYHIGVPEHLNGTTDPDFMTSQYGPESPLNVQNSMYWVWQTGYRFMIYEGRIDTLPDDPDNFPKVFSFHLGKDTLYSQIQVDLPFTVGSGTTDFEIGWHLDKNIYNDSDTLDFAIDAEDSFHGEGLEVGFRFRDLMIQAMEHAVD